MILTELLRELRWGPVRAKRYQSTQQEVHAIVRRNAIQQDRDERAQREIELRAPQQSEEKLK